MLRGSIIGTFVGIIPGLGTAIASFIAYNEEKRWSKRPADFGTGVEEGIASPEASNNAVVGACLIPSLALGIPGSASAAMVVGLLILKGIVPGPLMFEKSGPLIMLIFSGLILINFYMLAVSYLGLRVSTAIAEVPPKLLGPFVFILCLTGVYAYGSSFYHIIWAFLIGVFCWFLEKIEIPVIPIALGMVMQNLIEENLIGSLMIHQGDFSIFFTRPISAVVIIIAVFLLIFGFWRERTHAGGGEARA
jgi:putative tricarboxylic transport membrane protein